VIETGFLENHDFCIAAFMLSVAIPAFLFLDPAVKSSLVANVRCDWFMTIEAESRLRAAIEAYMAFIAFRLDFGVSLDDLPRHDRGLETLRAGGYRAREDEGDYGQDPKETPSTREQPRHG